MARATSSASTHGFSPWCRDGDWTELAAGIGATAAGPHGRQPPDEVPYQRQVYRSRRIAAALYSLRTLHLTCIRNALWAVRTHILLMKPHAP